MTPTWRVSSPDTLRALLIPADHHRPARLLRVGNSSVAISDAIGGGRLEDEPYTAELEDDDRLAPAGPADFGEWAPSFGDPLPPERSPRQYRLHLDADRRSRRLQPNERTAFLLARLGHIERTRGLPLLGDTLVTGSRRERPWDDFDVPGAVLTAARRAGLLAPGPPRTGAQGSGVPGRQGCEAIHPSG